MVFMTQTPPDFIRQLFDVQHQASRAQVEVPEALRRDRLERVRLLLDRYGDELSAAVEADFGVRSKRLTEIADMLVLRSLLAHSRRALTRWMRPQKVSTPLHLQPSRAYLLRQPLGVVGVVAPWNYPLQLALAPAITALAAGNRVMLKPSELTPRTSAVLAQRIGELFTTDEFAVVQGGKDVAQSFVSLPFDHLIFTGSTSVGRQVAASAAANLTPTTLELGGKSPCILDASADMASAALKIAHGKLLNAGQTCIAPDYLLLPRGREQAFAEAYARAVVQLFPGFSDAYLASPDALNPDYAAIINPAQRTRLEALLKDAVAQGARVQQIGRAGHSASGQMAPVLVFDTQPSMQLMQDEIFGPILPVLTYDRLDDAIRFINARPRPLALYWFGSDAPAQDRVLKNTVSGGVCINDTLMHVAHDNLPFGGVGDSGWGAYHGDVGFDRLTQSKPVLVSSRWFRGDLFYPPYGPRFDRVLGWIKRLF